MGINIVKAPQRVLDKRRNWASGDAKRDEGLVEPEDVVKIRNIIYSDVIDLQDGKPNCLDLYYPKDLKEQGGILPVIVNIHGGGYFYGDKELYRFYCMDLAKRGFAVANFDYRLAPEHHFPAPLEDTNDVMTWICQHAKEYQLDPQRVVIIGDSAGSQLSSQYAAIYSNSEYAALLGIKVPPIHITSISLACGMYDLIKRAASKVDDEIMTDYLGDIDITKDKRLDVLSYINENYPPAYVFSAKDDFLLSECEPMIAFLKEKGIDVDGTIYFPDDEKELGHVFHVNMKLEEAKRANDDQVAFMKKYME